MVMKVFGLPETTRKQTSLHW